MNNVVRFVRFEKPLAEIIKVVATGGVGRQAEAAERLRQGAVDSIRNEIEILTEPVHNDRWRILLKPQAELWNEGVRAGEILRNSILESCEDVEAGELCE